MSSDDLIESHLQKHAIEIADAIPTPELLAALSRIQATFETGNLLHNDGLVLFGSQPRGTLCASLYGPQIDVLAVLPYVEHGSQFQGGSTDDLVEFLAAALASAGRTALKDDRGIGVEVNGLRFRLFPSFKTEASDYLFAYQNGADWKLTNPKRLDALVTQANVAIHGAFPLLVRLLKAWNAHARIGLTGFHVEVMAVKHFIDYPERYTLASMLTGFFNALPGYIAAPSYDPSTGMRIDEYLGTGLDTSIRQRAADLAYASSCVARRAHGTGAVLPGESVRLWSEILFDVARRENLQLGSSSAS